MTIDTGNIGQQTDSAKPNGPDLAALDLDNVGGTPLDWALAYADAGLRVFPISAKKKPLVKWGEGATTDPDTIRQWWEKWPAADIGWALPDGVLVLDLDLGGSWRGLADFERLSGFAADLVETPQTSTPSGGRHLFFAVNGRFYKNWVKPIPDVGIDTKTIGGLVILPSPGNGRIWLKLPSLPLAGVPAWVPTVKPYEPSEQNEARPYAGETPYGRAMLARALSDIPEAENGFQAATLLRWCFTLGGLAAGGVLEFEPTLQALVDAALRMPTFRANDPWKNLDKIVERVMRAGRERPIAAPPEPEPPPQPSSSNLFNPWEDYIVPPFPLDVLPQRLQEFVSTQAIVVGCDPSAMAMATLVNFSAALDHRFALKMMRNGKWLARPRLWVLLVGPPSVKKSPVMDTATEEIVTIQNARDRAYIRELTAYKRAKEAGNDKAVEPVRPPTLVLMDVTYEKVADILSKQDRAGCLIMRDEIAGWIGSMEKYGRGGKGASADRGFWLQAYDGKTYSTGRIVRGTFLIELCSVSVLGGIQPKRLAEIHGLTSDGLLQRFTPIMMKSGTFPQDVKTDSAFNNYNTLTRRLIDARPAQFTLDDEALTYLGEVRRRLFDLEQVSGGLADGFESFVGKLPGIVGSLALILHLIDLPEAAMATVQDMLRDEVSLDTIQKAGRIVFDFLIPHAAAFYRTAENMAEGDRLQRLASYILTSGLTRFVASDFTSNLWHLRGLPLPELNKQISMLVAGGWLTPEAKREGKDQRPSTNPWMPHAWVLNPEVPLVMRERADAENRRKTELAALWATFGQAEPQKS
jgi:hypothetical protein